MALHEWEFILFSQNSMHCHYTDGGDTHSRRAYGIIGIDIYGPEFFFFCVLLNEWRTIESILEKAKNTIYREFSSKWETSGAISHTLNWFDWNSQIGIISGSRMEWMKSIHGEIRPHRYILLVENWSIRLDYSWLLITNTRALTHIFFVGSHRLLLILLLR